MSIPVNPSADGARESARQANGEFGTQPLAEGGDIDLVAPASPSGPKRLRSLAQVREDPNFLAAMEAAEGESRVLNVNKGDWVREVGDDEYGIVKSIGSKTLTTDTWRDEDTDYGDHVIAVVDKATAEQILEEHGVIPVRTQNAYAKRRTAAIELADRFDAATPGERRTIGYNEIGKVSQDIWRSAEKAGLAFPPDSEFGTSTESLPEIRDMEMAFLNHQTMLNQYGYSDELGTKLAGAMRKAVGATDRYFGERAPVAPHTTGT